jgi:hypothetical protein
MIVNWYALSFKNKIKTQMATVGQIKLGFICDEFTG